MKANKRDNSQHNISKLESSLKELRSSLDDLESTRTDIDEFLKIIVQPGWTTIPEFLFAYGIVENIRAQVKSAIQLHKVLMKAGGLVGEA